VREQPCQKPPVNKHWGCIHNAKTHSWVCLRMLTRPEIRAKEACGPQETSTTLVGVRSVWPRAKEGPNGNTIQGEQGQPAVVECNYFVPAGSGSRATNATYKDLARSSASMSLFSLVLPICKLSGNQSTSAPTDRTLFDSGRFDQISQLMPTCIILPRVFNTRKE
jgi:hypothetical protein